MKEGYFDILYAIAIFIAGIFVSIKGLNEYRLDEDFRKYGVETEAKFEGLERIKNQKGTSFNFYPIYSYIASDGIKRKHIAFEHGETSESDKKALVLIKVNVTFLPNKPESARIDKWIEPYQRYFFLAFGLFMTLASTSILMRGLKKAFPSEPQVIK